MYRNGTGSIAALIQLLANYHISQHGTTPGCNGKSNVIKTTQDYSKEYRLFNTKATYMDAAAECKEWGIVWESIGRLATISNMSTHNCLTEIIKTEGNYKPQEWTGNTGHIGYFVGGVSNHTGWMWSNGDQIHLAEQSEAFQMWGDNEPRGNSSGLKCMAMIMRGEEEVGTWVESSCEENLFFICERDIPERRAWGFAGNLHATPPQKWATVKKEYASCNGSRQSPVDIQINKVLARCDNSERTSSLSWENNTNVRLSIENTGRFIKMTTVPQYSIYANITGDNKRHYVDFMLIKWGTSKTSGSEHTIEGVRHAGEFQIFHHPTGAAEEIHAVSFILQERIFQPNEHWSELLRHISFIQKPDTRIVMEAPVDNIMTLLRDSVPTARFVRTFDTGLRYKGSLPYPPCTENVVWTVHTRPITLSFSQFLVFRHIHIEGRTVDNRPRLMNGNYRPIQDRESESAENKLRRNQCVVRLVL